MTYQAEWTIQSPMAMGKPSTKRAAGITSTARRLILSPMRREIALCLGCDGSLLSAT